MKHYFTDLLEIMDKESQIYAELKKVEQQKKKIIIENDVKALDAITKKEQGFVKTIVNLEGLRGQVIDGFCQSRGISTIDTIDEIMNYLSEREKPLLKEKRDALAKQINGILEVNDLNTMLLEQSLEYIEYTMGIARELTEEDAGYAEDAMDKTVKIDRNLFDAKV